MRMRTRQWKRKKTIRSIKRKASILHYKDVDNRDLYLNEVNRLDKISVSDLELLKRPKYNRSKVKEDTLFELKIAE